MLPSPQLARVYAIWHLSQVVSGIELIRQFWAVESLNQDVRSFNTNKDTP